ncbi:MULTISPECIES: bifunctional hydroxymethylpyrimidine kinase/phosphomethylpyrimidine kinase [unclassified Nocardioides]|uniref:bifunctional hydroxymethylpyrimidine kinase/phosphomethylpyrimidine kinase n=1 Tax=unclassified Nocardioides TaxID=2615069 RepID=UPI0009F0E317|nr:MULTISPECIES: bifunctional hydroxymethylpyrimidine kinase/phosphomethylpyrimidine kinase [unclassified Nocardioides]GAW49185.1 phosphomethylpyrimidine kinase [Nocardioides sp. PD653-B2]GAW55673.1 phosphomethylpyrimidine kinase [Nocardioides sp. PD653]
MTATPLVVLSVAGTDSGGAAGLAADLATFAALGVHGTCAVTAVTAQDTTGVHRVVPMAAGDVRVQIRSVLDDLPVAAAKTGMLGSAEVAHVVADLLAGSLPLVVDPVLVATSGAVLGDEALVRAYREVLLPRADVVTPNRDEAAALTGLPRDTDPEELALTVHALGPAVVLTGGEAGSGTCRDLVVRDGAVTVLEHPSVETTNDHGTGCTYSAALAVHLARGLDLETAARHAQAFVAEALAHSAPWVLGRGRGPVAHVFTHPQEEN